MLLSNDLKENFNKDGFVIIKNLISSEHAKILKTKVIELAKFEKNQNDQYIYKFDESGKTQRVWNLINKSKAVISGNRTPSPSRK